MSPYFVKEYILSEEEKKYLHNVVQDKERIYVYISTPAHPLYLLNLTCPKQASSRPP